MLNRGNEWLVCVCVFRSVCVCVLALRAMVKPVVYPELILFISHYQ